MMVECMEPWFKSRMYWMGSAYLLQVFWFHLYFGLLFGLFSSQSLFDVFVVFLVPFCFVLLSGHIHESIKDVLFPVVFIFLLLGLDKGPIGLILLHFNIISPISFSGHHLFTCLWRSCIFSKTRPQLSKEGISLNADVVFWNSDFSVKNCWERAGDTSVR